MPRDSKVYTSVLTDHLPRAGPHGPQSDAPPSSSHNHHAQDPTGISPLDLTVDPATMHDDGSTTRIHSTLIRDLHNQVQSLQAQVIHLQAESKLQQSILSTFTGTVSLLYQTLVSTLGGGTSHIQDFGTTHHHGGAA